MTARRLKVPLNSDNYEHMNIIMIDQSVSQNTDDSNYLPFSSLSSSYKLEPVKAAVWSRMTTSFELFFSYKVKNINNFTITRNYYTNEKKLLSISIGYW